MRAQQDKFDEEKRRSRERWARAQTEPACRGKEHELNERSYSFSTDDFTNVRFHCSLAADFQICVSQAAH